MKQTAILLYLASAAFAGAQGAAKTASPVRSAPPAFDMGTTSLPPHFTGDNAAATYDAAKNIPNPIQSEFESKSEYQARLIDLSKKPFWGTLTPNDHFAFVLGQAWNGTPPVSKYGQSLGTMYGYIETKYDAEAKELTVKMPLEPLLIRDTDGNFPRWVSLWHRTQVHLGSYVGQNAFGVKRTVNRLGMKDVDIVIEDSEWLDFDCSHDISSESCSIALDTPQARALSKSVRVVVVGSLVPPFVSYTSDVSSPSIDQPSELHASQRSLHLRLDELLIVNSESGEVMKTYSRKKHSEEYPVNVEFRVRKDGSFSDPRCTRDAYLWPSDLIEVAYSVDGAAEKFQGLRGSLMVPARRFVDVSIPYCNVSRVEVLVNGQQREMTCEKQDQFIGNHSKCNRIEITP